MKRDDRAKDPATAGDFYRNANDATSDPLVSFLTDYSRMIVTAEEIERQLLAAYGPDRMPGTESRRRSNMGETTSKQERVCAQCGTPLTWRFRFCSQGCYGEWGEAHPRPPLDSATLDEMRASLDRLGEEVGE